MDFNFVLVNHSLVVSLLSIWMNIKIILITITFRMNFGRFIRLIMFDKRKLKLLCSWIYFNSNQLSDISIGLNYYTSTILSLMIGTYNLFSFNISFFIRLNNFILKLINLNKNKSNLISLITPYLTNVF